MFTRLVEVSCEIIKTRHCRHHHDRHHGHLDPYVCQKAHVSLEIAVMVEKSALERGQDSSLRCPPARAGRCPQDARSALHSPVRDTGPQTSLGRGGHLIFLVGH